MKTVFSRATIRTTMLIGAVILSNSGPVSAADFNAGVKSFRAGDFTTAMEEWCPLAQAGDADAQHALGMMSEYGHGVSRDDEEAARWYLKAAEQEHAEAQYRLGVLHDNGWGVALDDSLAVEWYGRAAQLGHTFAQHDLAFMHFNGTGAEKDGVQAYKWLKIASLHRADLMAKHLSNVSKTLTADEIAEAEKLVQAWLDQQ